MASHRGYQLSLRKLSRRSLIYLGLPHAIFYAGWLTLPYALAASILLIAGIYLSNERTERISVFLPSRWNHRFLLLTAPLMALAVGIGMGNWLTPHMHYLWHNHLWQDLIHLPWPVSYESGNVLVHPLAYYLPSAWIGKILHPLVQILVEFWWGIYGMSLCFFWIGASFPRHTYRAVAIFALFGGVEILGRGLLGQPLADLSWMPLPEGEVAAMFPSLFDRFSAFPGQSMAAFLLSSLFYHQWRDGLSIEACIMAWGLTFLWSWWVALGALPFLVLLFWENDRSGWPVWVTSVIGSALGLCILAYAWPQIQALPIKWMDQPQVFIWYVVLIGLPSGLLLANSSIKDDSRWIMILLAALPLLILLISWGPGVDVWIGLSAVSFFWLGYEVIDLLLSVEMKKRWIKMAMTLCVLLGMIVPGYHLYRQIHLSYYPHLQAYDPSPISSLNLSQIPGIYMLKDLPKDIDRSPYYVAKPERFFFEQMAKKQEEDFNK
ncbi:MAG: hypothetical protein AAFR59_12450 [Bacteroidota bacterium]